MRDTYEMSIDSHDARIAVLESKLDGLKEGQEQIVEKLEEIAEKQLQIDVTAKIAYNTGKWILGISTGILSWLNWDALIALFHPPKH
jgi:chromosome segregation ATPase